MTNNYNQHTEMFKLLTHEGDGALSTISLDVPGYPFGSVVPYCLDAHFVPNILISNIAQHTKNIMGNNKVSLLISERSSQTNKQAQSRLTYLGEAIKVEDDEEIRLRYLRYFPTAKDYFKTHGFSFYQIRPTRLRYIGGFGKIYWIEKESLKLENIFGAEDEIKIINHMNQDHLQNLRDYARFYLNLSLQSEENVLISGLDQFGMDLLVNEIKHRIDFKRELASVSEARSVFVEMAQTARA